MGILDFIQKILDPPSARERQPRTSSRSSRATTSLPRDASDRYFALLGQLKEAKKARDWKRGAEISHQLMDVVPAFVRRSLKEYGDIPPNIPLFTDGARALVMSGDEAGLLRLRELTEEVSALEGWRESVDEALQDRQNVLKIRRVIEERPGILQTEVKDAIGAEDGRKVSTLLRQLEEGGEIQRVRYKRTYALGPPKVRVPLPEDHPASQESPEEPQQQTVEVTTTFDRHHQNRKRIKPREIDLTSVEHIPLPRAPARWEERHKKAAGPRESEQRFEVADTAAWELGEVEKLPMEERPDTAYRHLAPHGAGTFLIDDLGKAERFPRAPAALMSVTREGSVEAEAPLAWGLYRWEVNPLGAGFIAMGDGGVIHAYDRSLRRLFATPLAQAPEMRGLMKRYDFTDQDLKNHTRTVALSPSGDRYLFTVVDCAHVITSDGHSGWGLQLPKKEGWRRLSQASERAGTGEDVRKAIETLGLEMPISVDDVRTSYRRLAKKWHPDLNQGSEEAEERFKQISRAAEVLSGLELSSLAPDVDSGAYEKTISESTWDIGGMQVSISMGMQMSEKGASDWIYASAFAPDGGAFLAGYSGRVVRTDDSGRPLRVYDIGAVPRRIADTGDFLYFLTDTRLYILKDQKLQGVLDIFEEGDLVVGQTGFGLLDKKRFRWFTEEGALVGTVLTNNPIRRVHSTPHGLVAETRQRRAVIHGAPGWWE